MPSISPLPHNNITMHGLSPDTLKSLLAIHRLRLLYSRLPAGIVSSLVAVFLMFVMLLETGGAETAKPWTAFMLSVLGLRGWLWYAFHNQSTTVQNLHRWEVAYAFSALLMGLGWGWLCGPAFPANEFARYVVILMAVSVSFAGAVLVGLSCASFWLMILPTLLPALWRFLDAFGNYSPFSWMLCAVCLVMIAAVQTVHHRTLLENLRRRIESEALLSEQQAIFQSTTLGIAVIQGNSITKANHRLGELLGRRLQDLQSLPLSEHFVSLAELDTLLADSEQAFTQGRSYHGAFRMRRSDGREFWAEISGRRLEGDEGPVRSVWLIGEAPLRAAQ